MTQQTASNLINVSFEGMEDIGNLITEVPVIKYDQNGNSIQKIFDESEEVEGIVVVEGNSPVGLIMRTHYYKKISSRYGFSLYMGRQATLLMNKSFMTVNAGERLSSVAIKAMSRNQNNLYDYIIVVDGHGTYTGVINIRRLLIELSERREAENKILYEQQLDLIRANEEEKKLRKYIEKKSSEVKNLLDNAGEGFLTFGEDLLIKKSLSAECLKIFGKDIAELNYIDLLNSHFGEEKTSVLNLVLKNYFENTSEYTDNVFLNLLPGEGIINDRNICFNYKRIVKGDEKLIMVILIDVTDKKEMEQMIERDRNTQRLIIKSFKYRSQIKQLINEFNQLFVKGISDFEDGTSLSKYVEEMFRDVHTFKGDFAQFGFESTSKKIHLLEDRLNVLKQCDTVTVADLKDAVDSEKADEILYEDLNLIFDVLGGDFFKEEDLIEVSKEKIDEIEELIKSKEDITKDEIVNIIRSLKYKNIKFYLLQYEDYIKYLADKLVKEMPEFTVEGDDVIVDEEKYGGLFKSFVHIFRNSMDHGLENYDGRISKDKSAKGKISCIVGNNGDSFSINISDDGGGIDIDKIRNKALETGMYPESELNNMTDGEICLLIFMDNFSTADTVSSISGRGAGMAAVKYECGRLGGSIKVISEKDKGSTFIINIPFC